MAPSRLQLPTGYAAAGVDFPKSPKAKDWILDRSDFERAIKNIKGAPGFDGWGAKELRSLLRHCPFLFDELYDLWHATSVAAVQSPHLITEQLLLTLFSWRVVGIPKKTPMQSRPIGVASVLVRAWMSANAAMLPTPSSKQWANKAVSVVHAVADWLHHAAVADRGCEMDLTQAYDRIDHGLAALALTMQGCSCFSTAICTLAWTGPRWCQVDAEISRELTWPTRSLPQGESCAPGAMCATLVPWKPAEAKRWSFMDDRTLTTRRPEGAGKTGSCDRLHQAVRH